MPWIPLNSLSSLRRTSNNNASFLSPDGRYFCLRHWDCKKIISFRTGTALKPSLLDAGNFSLSPSLPALSFVLVVQDLRAKSGDCFIYAAVFRLLRFPPFLSRRNTSSFFAHLPRSAAWLCLQQWGNIFQLLILAFPLSFRHFAVAAFVRHSKTKE